MLKRHLPELLGPAGLLLATLVIIAIMAAAMSTADSNLHALSAVLTRDIYSGILRPNASEKSRLWVGRGVIAAATLLALGMVFVSRSSESFDPIGMIMPMMFDRARRRTLAWIFVVYPRSSAIREIRSASFTLIRRFFHVPLRTELTALGDVPARVAMS